MNLCLNVVEFKMFSIHSMKLATFQLIKIRFKKKKKSGSMVHKYTYQSLESQNPRYLKNKILKSTIGYARV